MSTTRQLAAIMFTDIVGYTILMGDDESQAMVLVRKNKEVQKPLVAKHRGTWLKEMGDGCMASFPTASDAIYCALEIQKQLKVEDLKIRIGIHLGEILTEDGDIYGDGVNIASRLETIADPGGIYISETVQKSIRSQSGIHTAYLGEMHLKNVDYAVGTYAIRGEGLPRPRQTLKKNLSGRLWAEIRRRNVHRAGLVYLAFAFIVISSFPLISSIQPFRNPILMGLAAGLPVALFLAWNFERSPKGFIKVMSRQSWENPYSDAQKKPLTGNAIIIGLLLFVILINAFQFLPDKIGGNSNSSKGLAVAVMPFRNDSMDPQNIYFWYDGGCDQPAFQIEGMRVPSVTSMLYYRENPKPYSEIVQELEVSYLLEGSVRKLKDQALMTVTLIDTEQNDQVWSNRYKLDLSVKDVWEVQFDVAQQIINSLQLALSGPGAFPTGSMPTASYEAYDHYLRARDLHRAWNIDENRKEIDLLLQALVLDSSFYSAIAELAQAYGQRAELCEGPWVTPPDISLKKHFG